MNALSTALPAFSTELPSATHTAFRSLCFSSRFVTVFLASSGFFGSTSPSPTILIPVPLMSFSSWSKRTFAPGPVDFSTTILRESWGTRLTRRIM